MREAISAARVSFFSSLMEVLLWEAFTQTVNASLEQVVLFVWENVSGEEMLQKHRM